MELQLKNLKNEALLAIKAIKDKLQLEELENKYLGRKSGELTELMKGLKDLSDTAKKPWDHLPMKLNWPWNRRSLKNEMNFRKPIGRLL